MVINQPFGIGDILFLEPLFRKMRTDSGEKPTLWVRSHLLHLQDYIMSVNMVPVEGMNIDDMEMREDYLPLRFANQVMRKLSPHDHHDFENMMLDKYRLVGYGDELWKNIFLNFNQDRALELFRSEVKNMKEYVLVNNYSGIGTLNIKPDTKLPVIKMRPIAGYSVVDWYLIMYHAKENHHVSTSTFFIFQAIYNFFTGIMPTEIFLYARPNEDGLRGISQLNQSFKYTPVYAN